MAGNIEIEFTNFFFISKIGQQNKNLSGKG